MLSDAPETIEEMEDEGEAEEVVESTPPVPTQILTDAAPPVARVVEDYTGVFANLREGLRAFLVSESISIVPSTELLNSVLATAESNSGIDWQLREGLQARMKIGFRRVLQKEGIDIAEAPERLLTWLKLNAPNESPQIQP